MQCCFVEVAVISTGMPRRLANHQFYVNQEEKNLTSMEWKAHLHFWCAHQTYLFAQPCTTQGVDGDDGGSPNPSSSGNPPPQDFIDPNAQAFWAAEKQVRFRTQGLTAYECEQLVGLETCTDERKLALSHFGKRECYNHLVSWTVAELIKVDLSWRDPGAELPADFPLWTLFKGIHLAETEIERSGPRYRVANCHCLPATAFMLGGCKCEEGEVSDDEIARSLLCIVCSKCVRCNLCLGPTHHPEMLACLG